MYDVIIIGAGLAGLAAAKVCKTANLNFLVLEASHRVGGRVWTKSAPGTNFPVDWGAEWIIPSMHHEVMGLVQSANLSLLEDASATPAKWRTSQTLFEGSYEHLKLANPAFAEALQKIEADAQQWLKNPNMQFNTENAVKTYFQSIVENTDTMELLEAALFPLTGADPATLSTYMLWSEIGFHNNSIDATLNAPTCRIAEGCDALAKTLAQELDASIVYNKVVSHIGLQGNTYAITSGETDFHANHCIVALPLRTLQDLSFDPPLAQSLQQTAANANAGRVAKAWALVESQHPLAETLTSYFPLRYGYCRPLDEKHALVCGQILSDGETALTNADASQMIKANWPEIKVIDVAVVDWPHEPFAKASWHSGRAGWAARTADFQHTQHNIHFAGGDIAEKWAGWMEGALLSGKDVGQKVVTAFSRQK